MFSDRKALAYKHVINGRHIVLKQRELIAQIKTRGGDCASAEKLLNVFERSLAIFEDDLARLSAV